MLWNIPNRPIDDKAVFIKVILIKYWEKGRVDAEYFEFVEERFKILGLDTNINSLPDRLRSV